MLERNRVHIEHSDAAIETLSNADLFSRQENSILRDERRQLERQYLGETQSSQQANESKFLELSATIEVLGLQLDAREQVIGDFQDQARANDEALRSVAADRDQLADTVSGYMAADQKKVRLGPALVVFWIRCNCILVRLCAADQTSDKEAHEQIMSAVREEMRAGFGALSLNDHSSAVANAAGPSMPSSQSSGKHVSAADGDSMAGIANATASILKPSAVLFSN